ncbi:MAG: tRNA lysidine(34) synthetase TilS [Alphaproteobacteria bacterium]|nr:tRNA lysidine(34) synthetase TilS [Alphaproteobacteria bacterium]
MQVTALLDALGPFEPTPHLAVALSGGADSTALLLLAREWAVQRGGTVSALIVDHRLRDDSTDEAKEVAARLGAIILTPEHPMVSNNLAERAREWRYDALTAWCRDHHVLHLLVAHHADDQAETVALHTERGDTEDGASAMAAVTIRDGVRILRPLLHIRKSQLEAYLRAHNASWVEDPTNANLTFKRNAIRHAMTDSEHERLIAIAQREGAARAQRDEAHARAAARVAQASEDEITLDSATLLALPQPIATRLLADSLCTVSGSHTRPRKHETEGLFARIQQPTFSKATLKHCLIEKRGTTLHISPEHAENMDRRASKPLAASPFWWLDSRSF